MQLLPDSSYQLEDLQSEEAPVERTPRSKRPVMKPSTSLFEESKWHERVSEATFANIEASSSLAGLDLYKYLFSASGRRLELWIPDTILINDRNGPLWVYSNEKGEVIKTDYFTDSQIISKLGNPYNLLEITAIIKRTDTENQSDLSKRIATRPIHSIDMRQILADSGKGRPFVLQKYIRNKGPFSYVCRTVYSANKAPYLYVITNKNNFDSEVKPEKRFIADLGSVKSASISKFKSGEFLKETIPYMKNLVQFLETEAKVQITLLACDFVKDEYDNWWFLGCKAIQHNGTPHLDRFFVKEIAGTTKEAREDYKKLKRCRICQLSYNPEKLIHSLNIKMITETNQLLKERGISISWLDRAEYKHSDDATFYQSYPVCDCCYSIYLSNQELKKVSNVYRKAFNYPPLVLEYKECPTQNMKMFRVMIAFSDLKESGRLKIGKHCLQFTMFNRQTRLNFCKNKNAAVAALNKVYIFHCFSLDRPKWTKYIKNNPKLLISLGEAECSLDVSSLQSPLVVSKTYYQEVMTTEETIGFLEITLGIEEIEVSNVPYGNWLKFKGLYIPPQSYMFPAPFLQEWVDLMPDKNKAKPIIPISHPRQFSARVSTSSKRRKSSRRKSKTNTIKRTRRDSLEFNIDTQSIDPSTNHSGTFNLSKLAPLSAAASDMFAEWELKFSVINLIGNFEPGIGPWRLAVAVMGSKFKFKSREVSRNKGKIRFESTGETILRCKKSALNGVLCTQKIECKVSKFEEFGIAWVGLGHLVREKQISLVVPVKFNDKRRVDLEVIVSLGRLRDTVLTFPVRAIAPGVEICTRVLNH